MPGRVRLVLVRHAESQWNATGRFQGHHGAGLTADGKVQAEAVAAYLHRTERDVALIARSDLVRVAETSAPAEACFGVEVVVDTDLRELDVGAWAGLTHDEVAATDPAAYAAWQNGDDPARGDGETFAQLGTRVTAALQRVVDRVGQGTALVFTHGGPIRVAVAGALEAQPGGERHVRGVANASLTVLEDHAGERTLIAYNVPACTAPT